MPAMLRCCPFVLLVLPLAAQVADSPLSRLPADARSVLVVRDVMPHAEAMLASAPVRALLAATGDLQQQLFGGRYDAAALQRQLSLVQAFVPTEVAIAASASATQAMARTVGAAAALAALLAADTRGDEDELAALREAAGDLAAGAEAAFVAHVRLRDERMAERWFDSAVAAGREVPARDGLEVVVKDSSITVQMASLPLPESLRRRLAGAGVELPVKLAAPWTATLTQRGPELRLVVGKPAAPPLAPGDLGRLWRDEASAVLYGRLELGDGPDGFGVLLEHVHALSTGDAAVSLRPLAGLLSQVADLAPIEEGVVQFGTSSATVVHEADYGEELAGMVDAPPAAFARCLAPSEGPFLLNALPLDALLASAIDQVRQRFWRRGAELPPQAAKLVEFVEGEQSAVFQPGVVVLGRAGAFRGAPGIAGPLPWATGAIVAKAVDGESAREFMRELGVRLRDACELEAAPWVPADLGLGEATMVLDIAAAPALKDLDADLKLHWLVVDDVLVIATDVALTKDLLQRLRGTGSTAVPSEHLIDWTVLRGDHLAAWCDAVGAWLPHTPLAALPAAADAVLALRALAALARQVNELQWVTDVDGTRVRQRFELRLRTGDATK